MAMVLSLLPMMASAETKAVVSSRHMTVYRSKNTAVGRLEHGTVVTVKSSLGGMAKISYKGKIGYAPLEDLSPVKPTIVCDDGAKVYISANIRTRSVTVEKGTEVNILSVSGNWARIERKGNIGYIDKNSLALYHSGEAEKPEPGKVQVVLAAARVKLGCRYVYGDEGPETFDCSGLTQYAYHKVGVVLSRSAYSQGYGKGQKLTMDDLEPGDLVCFNTIAEDVDLVDHVGIYLGGGEFIHASSARGQVIISSLSSGYYKRVFSWGKRVL